jgi:D-alanyl-D-alanine carboxypeptidase
MKKQLVFVLCLFGFLNATKAQNLDNVISFMKENPQKASLYLMEDGKTIIDFNSHQQMPLASAVKTIIAIEFAKQCTAKKISPLTKIAVKDLDKYYLSNTDGGAHPKWLKSIGKSETDSANLLEIAKGMIRYSSNANTEFLQDLLGLININKNLKELALKEHRPLYYFTASALMTCLKPADMEEAEWVKKLSTMPMTEYHKKCEEAHQKLKADSSFIKQFNFANLSLNVQKVWSDRLVASTTADYAQLMQKIASGKFFDSETQSVLESIMEWPMAYAGNKTQFNHLGQKGGSTSFILTDTFYSIPKTGPQLACAFFFNDLSPTESALINRNFGAFEASILTNVNFRKKIQESLK